MLSALVLWLLSVAVVIAAGAWPTTRNADAIVVLGAAQYNGRPSPVLQARLDHALALYHSGRAAHLIFTGGTGVGDTVSEAEV
ncbi:MAG: YdcF family protein, partial [Longimicrobiales bacterium]